MIDVLFKAKVKDENDPMNGEWVQGYFVALHFAAGQESFRIYTGKSDMDCGTYCPEWHEIDPETAGQYAGKKDKNGKMIFDGDIVKDTYNGILWFIQYIDCGFCGKSIKNELFDDVSLAMLTNDVTDYGFGGVEVIGNIYDNPELLEEKCEHNGN